MSTAKRRPSPRAGSVFDLADAQRVANKSQIPRFFIEQHEKLLAELEAAGIAREDVPALVAQHRGRRSARTIAKAASFGLPESPVIRELIVRYTYLAELVGDWARNPRSLLTGAVIAGRKADTARATAARTKYSAAEKLAWIELYRRPEIASLSDRKAATRIRLRLGADASAEGSIRKAIAASRQQQKPSSTG